MNQYLEAQYYLRKQYTMRRRRHEQDERRKMEAAQLEAQMQGTAIRQPEWLAEHLKEFQLEQP